MKKLICLGLLLLSSTAFAEFKTVADAEKKLATYTVADIEGDEKRLAKGEKLKIDEIFDDLDSTVELLKTAKVTEELALQMERVAVLASLHDSSNYALDIIVPVFEKNKVLFRKASESLHPVDRRRIMEPLNDKAVNATEGNG